jgi:predicted lysophospholipase L1 biosynthesis ABC-type transport system permease subunit
MGFRRVDGPHPDSANDWHSANTIYVTPEYFQAPGIPLLRGRGFSSADGPKSAQVIVVNQAFAKAHLRDMEPVGIHLASGRTAWEIVGMVGDVQQKPDFGDAGMIGPAPAIYMPATQAPDDFLQLVNTWFPVSWAVRASGPAQGLAEGISRAISDTDWQLPVTAVEPMEQVRSDAIRGHRVQAVLVGMLAALALVLAGVGIYGLVANLVAVRTRELGIRLAIGATVRQAVVAAALPGVILAVAGAAVGCGLAAGTTNLMRHLLYGVTAGDPVTVALAAVILVFVAAVASLLPAWRVTRLNPADTLRHD